MMIFVKIFTILVTLIVLSKTYLEYKKKKETLAMFLFWSITWSAVAIFAVWQKLYFDGEIFLAQFGLGTGTFFGLIFVFLFFVTYRVYVKAHRLERQLRDLVMKIGLKDVEEE